MRTILLCILLLGISGCDTSKETTTKTITVFAAASTTNAITDITATFKTEYNIEVVTNFASSSALAQQIENGADVDLYLSANQKWADYLEDKDFCNVRNNIVSNKIVIIVPADSDIDSASPETLLSPSIINIAMGDPTCVPAGKYGKEALNSLNIWDSIKSKVSAAKDVRSALAYVETKAAEAGIVYSTDAAISKKVKVVFQFPDQTLKQPITYPAMTINNCQHPEQALLFLDYLTSDTAKDIFNEYGFITE